MQLVDIGANLTHDSFDRDRDAVLERARAAGVVQLVVTGASRQGSIDAHGLAQAHACLYATAGVHPHHASDYDADTDALLRALAGKDKVQAVGETGLDYHRNYSPRADQLRAFELQLQIAVDTGKPLFLHQRDAHADLLACLDAVRDKVSRAVVHCFTGSRRELYDYLDRDLYIGITGWLCDERRGAHLRQFVREIPAGRLMLETDSPYLLPRTLQPKPPHRRNEPMYLPHICEELARDRDEPVADTAAATAAAARAFFDLPAA